MEEPFFGKDDPVRLQRMGPTAVTYFLGDRFHFRSALISFRRIWMCSESSHWKDIVEYLMEPHLPSQVANTARHYQGAITSETQKDGFPAKVNVVRIIDLWLNTVFAHDGLVGPNERAEFERLATQHGSAAFEYAFRTAVKAFGFHFINLANLAAKPALEFLKTRNETPTFKLVAAFGRKRRERLANGNVIIREGSSEFASEELLQQRFGRLLRRHEHRDLFTVCEQLDVSEKELLYATLRATDFMAFMADLGGVVNVGIPSEERATRLGARLWAHVVSHRVAVYPDNEVETDLLGVEMLSKVLTKMRNELLRE